MALTYPAQLRAEILARRARPSQQFGQPDDASTRNGATGCTDTVLQWLVWRYRGLWVSHDAIRRAAGSPPATRGLRASEVQRVADYHRLPYRVALNVSATRILELSERGPVGFGHAYSHWPEWSGYRYGVTVADGKPNGYATPTGAAGRTQLSGFNGAHFGLLLGVAAGDDDTEDLVYAWEPNHGSPARPERPPYDRMSRGQFATVYRSYQKVLGRTPYALIPEG